MSKSFSSARGASRYGRNLRFDGVVSARIGFIVRKLKGERFERFLLFEAYYCTLSARHEVATPTSTG